MQDVAIEEKRELYLKFLPDHDGFLAVFSHKKIMIVSE